MSLANPIESKRIRAQKSISLVHSPSALLLSDSVQSRAWSLETLDQPFLLEFLQLCSEWTDRGAATTALADLASIDLETARESLASLMETGLLEIENESDEQYAVGHQSTWQAHGWDEAFRLHWITNSLPKLDYTKVGEKIDREKMQEFVSAEAPPPHFKTVACSQSFPLPDDTPPEILRFEEVVRRDAVAGPVRSGPLALGEFSWLTKLAFGRTHTTNLFITGEHVGKTSPSGGSRHPTEVYFLALDVEGLPAGVYHYNFGHHRADLIAAGDYREFFKKHVVLHPDRPEFSPAVVYLFATYFERSMYRYRDSRSYRVIHLDLGHLVQTAAYVATSLGRQYYRGYTMEEREVEPVLGVDGLFESVMAFCAVG